MFISTPEPRAASDMVVGPVRPFIAIILLAGLLSAGSIHKSGPRSYGRSEVLPKILETAYKKAKKAEKEGDTTRAYILYAQAAALDPNDRTDAWARSLALRRQALEDVDYMPPSLDDAGESPAVELDASLLGRITREDLREADQPLPPITLAANAELHDFDLRGDARTLYEQVASAYGLDVIFDAEFDPGQPVRFHIEGVGYRDGLRILGAATGTFVVPVSESLVLVANDTQQKRQELEHNMAATIPIPETVSVQEAQELARAVQQVMEIKKLVIDSARRLVLVRDRVSRVRPAQALFEQLLQSRPEVVVEVEFVEVSNQSSLQYGIKPPDTIGIAFLGLGGAQSFIPLGFPITWNLWGLTLGNAELTAKMSESSSRILMRSRIRSVSGQPAQFHVGDRYPIQTNAYIGDVSSGGQVYTPPPQINFEDLGVLIKVTPYVHGEDEITLELEAEFKVLTGAALNGLPVVSNRSFQGVVRLKSDESAIMAGLVDSNEARILTGLPGLGQIPYLGALFRMTTKTKDDSQTLLVLKPSIVRMPMGNAFAKEVWTGTETRPVNPL